MPKTKARAQQNSLLPFNALEDGAVQTVRIGDVLGSITCGVSVNAEDRPASDGEHGVLTLSAVSEGRFLSCENKAVADSDVARLGPTVRAKTLLITRSNTTELVGTSVYVDRDYPNLHLPDLIWELTVADDKRYCPKWLNQVLSSPQLRVEIEARATGTSGSMKKLSMSTFRAIKIRVPPFEEQKRVEKILSTWDAVAAVATKLLDAKQRLKAGLLQKLLTKSLRFPEFVGMPSETVRLADVTRESAERNGADLGTSSVRAVNKVHGMIPMRERIIGANLARYQVVRHNWFAYNPMRLNIGSLAQWQGTEEVLVSPDYVVFWCDESRLDPDYLDHIRRSNAWDRFVTVAGNGSVRVRIYYADLAAMQLELPPLKEQQRIAKLLNALGREIGLIRRQLGAFRKQKVGLMRRLIPE